MNKANTCNYRSLCNSALLVYSFLKNEIRISYHDTLCFLPNFSVPRFLFLFPMYFSLTSYWISAFPQSCHLCLLPRLIAVTEEVCFCLGPCAKSEEVLRRCSWGLLLSSLDIQIHIASSYLLKFDHIWTPFTYKSTELVKAYPFFLKCAMKTQMPKIVLYTFYTTSCVLPDFKVLTNPKYVP